MKIDYDSKDFELRLEHFCITRSCSDCAFGDYYPHCFPLIPELVDSALRYAYEEVTHAEA